MKYLLPHKHWERGFESYSKHECFSPMFILYVDVGLATGCSPIQGVLPTYILTHSRSWALLEEPLKNFPAFHGTERFNTVFTRALHWSVSWAISIQFTPSHPISLGTLRVLPTACKIHNFRIISEWEQASLPISSLQKKEKNLALDLGADGSNIKIDLE
jgi:hypothetical protein